MKVLSKDLRSTPDMIHTGNITNQEYALTVKLPVLTS